MSDSEPTIHFKDDTVAIASWRDLFIESWWNEGSVDHLKRVRREHNAFFAKHRPTKTAQVAIVHKLGVNFDGRHELTERYQEMVENLSAGVVIVPSIGFAGSIIRSIIAGLTMIRKPPYPWKLSESASDAGAFLSQHLKRDPSESSALLAQKAATVLAAVAKA